MWQERAWSLLLSRAMHFIKATIIIVNVCVSTTSIDLVHHVSKLAIEISMRRIIWDVE